MSTDRFHRTVSADGTEIAGRVHGQGPPLVFISSALGDDSTSWAALTPTLSDNFTCYLMSTRGRGLSEDHPDHTRERLLEDITAFVDSLDAPIGLVGHSSAGVLALEVAARCAAVAAVAVYEPTFMEFANDDDAACMLEAMGKVQSLAERDRLVEAATVFFADLVRCPDDELETLVQAGAPQVAASYVPVAVNEIAQSGPPRLSEPEVLEQVTAPVLVLTGSRTPGFWHEVSGELARRLAHADVRTVDDVAHFAPLIAPDRLAGEFTQFFEAQLQPLGSAGRRGQPYRSDRLPQANRHHLAPR